MAHDPHGIPDQDEPASLYTDTRAVAYVEYVTLLAVVTLGAAIAIFAVGAPLLTTYRYAQLLLSMPFP